MSRLYAIFTAPNISGPAGNVLAAVTCAALGLLIIAIGMVL